MLPQTQKAQLYDVSNLTPSKYKVKSEFKTYVVDLDEKKYSCRRFDLDLMPSSHAVAIIRYIVFIQMYSGSIMPVPHPEEWDVPSNVRNLVVLSPSKVRQASRPKTSRMRSTPESSSVSRRYGCSRCGERGYNVVNCTVEIDLTIDLTAGSATRLVNVHQPSRRQRKEPGRCGFC
ncbi:hypothetical protein PTKIN_Ptkin10aG0121200 [Pterospermum kingtungense]